MSALSYLNNPTVFRLLLVVVRGITSELALGEAAYGAEHTGNLHMDERFLEWFIDLLQWQQSKVSNIMTTENTEGLKIWGTRTDSESSLVLEVLDLGKEFVDEFDFDSAIKTALGWN